MGGGPLCCGCDIAACFGEGFSAGEDADGFCLLPAGLGGLVFLDCEFGSRWVAKASIFAAISSQDTTSGPTSDGVFGLSATPSSAFVVVLPTRRLVRSPLIPKVAALVVASLCGTYRPNTLLDPDRKHLIGREPVINKYGRLKFAVSVVRRCCWKWCSCKCTDPQPCSRVVI